MKKCKIEGCTRPYECGGFCRSHYYYFHRYGDPLYVRFEKFCKIEGCDRTYNVQGYCQPHYRRWLKYGNPLFGPPIRIPINFCTVSECDEPHRGKGYCKFHLYRFEKYGNPLFIRFPEICSINGCTAPSHGKGMCQNHYKQWRYNTDINFHLAVILRSRINKAIKRKERPGSAVTDLGCSLVFFKSFIESLFSPGMIWDNYGKWELDHVFPLSDFDLTDRAQFLLACNWKNYQPLWVEDNRKKSGKVGTNIPKMVHNLV